MLAVRIGQLTAEDFHLIRCAALSAAPRTLGVSRCRKRERGTRLGRPRARKLAPFPPAPHRTVRNRFRVTRLSSGHDSPLQDNGYSTPFPGYRTPPVALRPVAGFPNLRLLRPLCDPRALTP